MAQCKNRSRNRIVAGGSRLERISLCRAIRAVRFWKAAPGGPGEAGTKSALALFACIALSLSACKRSPDVPAPQSPPKPQTGVQASAQASARFLAQSGIAKAVFSYSVRSGEPCQIDRPIAASHRPPET